MRLEQQTNSVHALLVEASQCLADDRTAKAKKLAEQAVAMAPGSADAHMVLADVLANRSEQAAARKHYETATNCDRYHFGAWLNFGVFLKENGETRNAVNAFKNAVMIDEKSSLARYNLARTLLMAQQFLEASEQFQIFIKMEPRLPDVHYSLGVTQDLGGMHEEAIESHETALKLDPNYARAYFGIGLVHQALGRFETAEPYFRKAIELEPAFGKGYAALTVAQRISDQDADEVLATLKAELADDGHAPATRINFMASAFRILDRQGEYDEAFEYLREFNQLRDAAFADRQEEQATLWARQKATFTPEFFEKRTVYGDPTEKPIFIVGMPRSGTTLTEQIVASHPEAHGAGELTAVGQALGKAQLSLKDPPPYPQFVAELPESGLRDLAQDYLAAYPKEAASHKRVTDKLPDNYVNLGALSLMFPNARFIWCRRNAIDTCLSCYIQNFTGALWYCFNQEKLARRYRDHVDLNEYWKEVLPNRFLEVRYEELTQNPEPSIRRLIDFCGLEWDDACLNFHETERAVRTASLWQVRQPMYTSSVDKWKNYEKHLGPLIEGLGDLAHA